MEKIKAAYVEPEYKEALKYLNKLCTEGLLSPSSFTSDGAQTRQTIQNPSGVQVGCFYLYGTDLSYQCNR